MRYAFGTLYDEASPPEPLPEDRSATEVECDGLVQTDTFDVELREGARLVVTSDDQTVTPGRCERQSTARHRR